MIPIPFSGAAPLALLLIIILLLTAMAILVWVYQEDRHDARKKEARIKRAMAELRRKEKEAQESKAELEKTKLALMNMVEDLSGSYEKLKELDRLKSDFVTNVSHELRTPITTITLSFDLLRKEKDKAKRNELLRMMQRNVGRLSRTVNTILDFSAMEAGAVRVSKEKVELRSLIREVSQEEMPKARVKGIALTVKAPAGIWVYADRELAHRALLNIVDNAIKFTDKGCVRIYAKKQKDYIIVSVKDSGRGIRKSDLPKIFGKFAKLEEHVPGSGIGLWVSKKIIEQHGGKIEAKSKRGAGTEITVTFPMAAKK